MIDLSKYLNQEITVRLADSTFETDLIRVNSAQHPAYPFLFSGRSYTKDGFYWSDKDPDDRNIVAILTPVETGDLSLKELKERKAELEKELEAVKTAIKTKGVPKGFDPVLVTKILSTQNFGLLTAAFEWGSTPQGQDHWNDIRQGHKELSQDDIRYLTDCIAKSFLEDN